MVFKGIDPIEIFYAQNSKDSYDYCSKYFYKSTTLLDLAFHFESRKNEQTSFGKINVHYIAIIKLKLNQSDFIGDFACTYFNLGNKLDVNFYNIK